MTKSYDLPRYAETVKRIMSEVLDEMSRTDEQAEPDTDPTFEDYVADIARRFAVLAHGPGADIVPADAKVQPFATDENAIYAVAGFETTGITQRANRWFWQIGNRWVAVAPWESFDEWFEDAFADGTPMPPQVSYPIERIPSYGTLSFRDHDGTPQEVDAITWAAQLRDRIWSQNEQDERQSQTGEFYPHGRCDTCGAPCTANGCTRDETHVVALRH